MLTKGDKGWEEIGALPRARRLEVPYATIRMDDLVLVWPSLKAL